MCFMLPEDIAKAKAHVETCRKGNKTISPDVERLDTEDVVERGLKIPASVLNECEKSFKAADEN